MDKNFRNTPSNGEPSLTTKEIEHEENCKQKTNGKYSIGCVACIYKIIEDGIYGLSIEAGDMVNQLEHEEKQKYFERLNFFMQLKKHLP